MTKRIILWVIFAFFVCYSGVAFITADIGWMRGMWNDWSRGDRAGFLYMALICVVVGVLCGAWINPRSPT